MNTKIPTTKKISNTKIAAGAFLLALAGGILAKLIWTASNSHDPGTTLLEGQDYPIGNTSDKRYADDHRKYEPD